MQKTSVICLLALLAGCSDEPKDDPQTPSEMGSLFYNGGQVGIDKSQGLIKSDEAVSQPDSGKTAP